MLGEIKKQLKTTETFIQLYMRKIKLLNLLLIISAFIFALTGCKKDDDGPDLLPPASSMEMDFSFTKKKSAFVVNDSANYSNYFVARTTVAFWSIAAAVHTAIPVYAFKTAISNKPVYDKEHNTYTWSFNFKFASDNYIASLTGEVDTEVDSVFWQMKITKVGTSDPAFLWYEGRSAMDRSGGWWILYNPVLINDNNAVGKALKIDWTRDNETDGVLRYTNIITGDANNGAYIEFGSDVSADLDKYFEIYIKSAANPENNEKTYTIEWSSTNNNGHIKEGNNKYCWDKNYLNTICQ
jgi:hypothetical protein